MPPLHALIARTALLAPLFLAACATPAPRDSLQLGTTRIGVIGFIDDRGDPAGFGIQLGEAKPVPLTTTPPTRIDAARIDSVWTIGASRLVLLAIATKDCPRAEQLLLAQGETIQAQPLGKCPDRFTVTASAEQWSARQSNARDPINWSFRDGKLSGPVLQSVLNRARARLAQPERPPEPERPAEPEHPAETPQAPAAGPAQPERPANPVQPPPVSRPVGDDVVPPPVGAAPLPGHTAPAPRVF